jgi:hypothetical protein
MSVQSQLEMIPAPFISAPIQASQFMPRPETMVPGTFFFHHVQAKIHPCDCAEEYPFPRRKSPRLNEEGKGHGARGKGWILKDKN